MGQVDFMRQAIALSVDAIRHGLGGPFGAVIVKDGRVVGAGRNEVTSRNDPTAHAEIVAIREACEALDSFSLEGCEIFTSCEPCPMCLSAIYWARLDRIYYGNTREDAMEIGFDDARLYEEINRPIRGRTIPTTRLLPDEAAVAFAEWREKPDKVMY